MSSIVISGALSNVSSTAQATSAYKATAVSAVTTSQAGNNLKENTVKISVAAQAKLMHRQGLSASVIAASLGTNVASVDGYLNIKVAAQAAAAVTTAASDSTPKSTATTEATAPEATSTSTTTEAATAKS